MIIHFCHALTCLFICLLCAVSLQVSASVDVNPTKCYLDFLSLPNDDHTRLELKQVAAIAMSYLDRIAEPYSRIQEVWLISVITHKCTVNWLLLLYIVFNGGKVCEAKDHSFLCLLLADGFYRVSPFPCIALGR